MINEGKGPISVQDLINFMWSDKPLIELYDGRFEACFVIFHPFTRFPSEIQKNYIIATQNDYREKRKELSEDDFNSWFDTLSLPQKSIITRVSLSLGRKWQSVIILIIQQKYANY